MCKARIESLDQNEIEDVKRIWVPRLQKGGSVVGSECPVVLAERWMKSEKWCVL